MPYLVSACFTWWRTRRARSPRWQAGKDALVGLLVVVAVLAAGWYGHQTPFAQQVLAGSMFLAGAALLVRARGLRLFGPVLGYDLVRSARSGRQVLARSAYAAVVLAVLLWTYTVWLSDTIHSPRDLWASASLPTKSLAHFANSFFGAFVAIQLLAAFALTPAYTAGVLAQEKQRGTLEALLATDLRSFEIVLSLLLSRLANLVLLLATGLPILSLTLLWGGVDPELVLAAYAGTGLTLASLAGLSILHSVHARRPRDAVGRAYLTVAAYLVLSGLAYLGLLWAGPLGWGGVVNRVLFPGDDPVTVRDVLEWPCLGNPLVALHRFDRSWTGGSQGAPLWDHLRDYGLFHILIAFLCTTAAVVRLRAVARKQSGSRDQEPVAAPVRQPKKTGRARRPRPVAARGMLWKETVVEARPGRGALGWLWLGVRVAILFWPALHICYHLGQWLPSESEPQFARLLNFWVRVATVLMGCSMLLGVAVRAAGSVSGERDRRTLDGLLATPLENRTLLCTKWLGSILSPRGAWLRLGLVWAVGICTRALHPLAVPCLLLTWFVYAAFVASLGLWFSVISRSAQRAMIGTLLATAGCVLTLVLAASDLLRDGDLLVNGYALVPPVTLGRLTFSAREYDQGTPAQTLLQMSAIGVQFAAWSLVAGGLYVLAGLRFRALTGRVSAPAAPPVAEPQTPTPRAPAADEAPAEEDFLVPQTGPRWPLRLRNAALVLFPLALLTVWYGYLLGDAERDLQEAIAETDRLDPQWRLEDVEAHRLALPDGQNSAPQALKARSLVPKDWDVAEVDRLLANLTPEVQLQPPEVEAVRAALAKVQPALAEARRLSDLPHGRYPVTWSRDGFSTQLPHVQGARTLTNLLALDVLLRAQEKDADGALASCRGVLNAGRSIGDEPTMISMQVRMAIVQIALHRIERTLAQGEPSDAALAALQRLLLDEDRQPVLLFGLRGERGGCYRFLEAVRSGDAELSSVFGSFRNSWQRWLVDMTVPFAAGSLKSWQADFLRRQTQLVEAAKLPSEQQDARFGQLGPPPPTKFFARWLYPAYGRLVATYRREQAQVRCALTALAVERYRRQHGRWPASLAALTPELLAQVPLDPYDGQPLRYRRLTDGVVVYSVGPDLTDNGGKLDRKNLGATGTDLGLQLWDTAQRRQRPSKPAARKDKDAEGP